ncbi:hypothetical protein PVAG01_01375 [Phlyctema vagabunda]|uniref:CSN8/PSMD8/EIF3K domain-containing protein n=1 Tax=Phlyctema vagabunda TaxID=108571 RepID=A0ABR4PYD2_9HELO
MSARGGRTPSGPWNRLKPVNLDALEAFGLPSKGDNRLLNSKTQETYYTSIVDRYMAFCSDAGRGDELLRRQACMEATRNNKASDALQQAVPSTLKGVASNPDVQRELSVLMMAMRKLREGIVASKRADSFSVQAYIFCIRFSIAVKHMESYHPAILHLLRKMHTVHSLTGTELQEFVGYLVLDLACRQQDLAQAYSIRNFYRLKDSKVDAVLQALARDNFFLFWRVKRSVDGHKAKLMEFAEDGIRKQTLKCLGRAYLSIDQPSLERFTATNWATLVNEYEVGWELTSSKVTIRKPKTR